MARDVFPQTTIAIIWDFDKTLTPDYMQKPLFEHYKISGVDFWSEVNQLDEFYRNRGLDLIEKDTLYLNHILTYVREGIFKGLSNNKLLELGNQIAFYPGVVSFLKNVKKFPETKEDYQKFKINVEHFVVSSGLRKMILGSKISKYLEFVWACEFVSEVAPPGFRPDEDPFFDEALNNISPPNIRDRYDNLPIADIGYVIDNTTKTRAVFEINKGTNIDSKINVNAPIAESDRRIPFKNMIYIADGPSDVPVFSVVKRFGGKTYAVFKPKSQKEFEQVDDLLKYDRIDAHGEANYIKGTPTHMWIMKTIENIADRIVEEKKKDLNGKIGKVPQH
jgi:hypothetical protein